ncbi:MAG: isoprenylcysteine carboxylmethyltransferase family protein [Theionarchaea archaeon]|nr:isoprenylcysteine carboxylmethyltransferase family protein [Theionarchaea archaeon]
MRILRSDWHFISAASLIFFSSLFVTLWDFTQVQNIPCGGVVSVVGLILFATGVGLRIATKRTLGKSYTYTLKPGHTRILVTHSMYQVVRHPIYLAMILYTIAIPLIFSSLIGLLLMLGLIPCILYRIGIEEKMLLKEFGDQYKEYITTTKKLIPFIY